MAGISRAYNKLAIHDLGANASPTQNQWLQRGDIKIPRKLARPRFTTKYYERFLDLLRPQPGPAMGKVLRRAAGAWDEFRF